MIVLVQIRYVEEKVTTSFMASGGMTNLRVVMATIYWLVITEISVMSTLELIT